MAFCNCVYGFVAVISKTNVVLIFRFDFPLPFIDPSSAGRSVFAGPTRKAVTAFASPLVGGEVNAFQNRVHFFAAERVLVDVLQGG